MIPKEIYTKYNLVDIEEYESDYDFYITFLAQTDHIPNKIIEAVIEDLAAANLVDFVSVFIKFIASVRVKYKDVLECRKFARDEINRLEAGE